MSIQPIAAFRTNVRACWITTYNLDLSLFDSFLLPRLGDPPLNAVVLADAYRLDRLLERIPSDEQWRLDRANRRWLLRGVAAGGAFHPKSLLLAGKNSARLLVGSGNLSLSGLDEGNEAFVEFTTDTEEGAAAIAAWIAWMHRIINLHGDDDQLAGRFADLVSLLPPEGDATPEGLQHNLDRPILDQFVEAVDQRPVEHLHLTAPFFDQDAAAVAELLSRLQPDRTTVYLAAGANVDGPTLRRVLESSGTPYDVMQYIDEQHTPVGFVHAKLVGVQLRDSGGLALAGSANLSRAALLSVVAQQSYANVELGTVTAMPAGDVPGLFVNAPGLMTRPLPVEDVATLEFTSDEEPAPALVRLLRARRGEDGGVVAAISSDWDDSWRVTDGTDQVPNGQPLDGRLVWIIDQDGETLSNRVVVDEPGHLAHQLEERDSRSSDTPEELNTNDLDHPLGQVLSYVQQSCIMDVADTRAVQIADRGADEDGEEASSDLWDRLASQELRRDPRISTYDRLSGHTIGMIDPLADLLAAMLARSPQHARDALSNIIPFPGPTSADGPGEEGQRPLHRWSTNTRIRIRARNVLRRWADAIGDERLQWIDPTAPLVNYRTLIDALAWLYAVHHINEEGATLTEDDLDDIFKRLLDAALPLLLNSEDLYDVLPEHTLPLTTALLYLDVRVDFGQRARVLAWQPTLQALLDADLLRPTQEAARYVSQLLSKEVTTDGMLTVLLEAIDYIDDREWSRRQKELLGLSTLELEVPPGGQQLDVRVRVGGIDRPLSDPTTVRLIDALRAYRDADAVALFDAADRWRIVVRLGDHVALTADWLDEAFVESRERLDSDQLAQLMTVGSSLADLFDRAHRAAA